MTGFIKVLVDFSKGICWMWTYVNVKSDSESELNSNDLQLSGSIFMTPAGTVFHTNKQCKRIKNNTLRARHAREPGLNPSCGHFKEIPTQGVQGCKFIWYG